MAMGFCFFLVTMPSCTCAVPLCVLYESDSVVPQLRTQHGCRFVYRCLPSRISICFLICKGGNVFMPLLRSFCHMSGRSSININAPTVLEGHPDLTPFMRL